MKSPFEIRSTFAPDALVVTVSGEIDMGAAPQLVEAIEAGSQRTERVVVDLTEVTFLDSSALNALLRAQRTLTERGSALRLVAPSDGIVRRIFEIANLLEPLNVVESRDEAGS